jgi:hypothetical protein
MRFYCVYLCTECAVKVRTIQGYCGVSNKLARSGVGGNLPQEHFEE